MSSRLLIGLCCLVLGFCSVVALVSWDDDGGSPSPVAAERARDQRELARQQRELSELKRRLAGARRGAARRQARELQGAEGAILSSADIADFKQLEASLDGEVGLTVGAVGSSTPTSVGSLRSGVAWSTIKVPIALRVLVDAGGPGGLSQSQRSAIASALTASDNEAAKRMFDSLASEHGGSSGATDAVTQILRKAGDSQTVVSEQGRDGFSPYGQTEWSLQAQHQFMAALAGGCLADSATTKLLLSTMGDVTSDQRWGLGSGGRSARIKGGWGPGTEGGYLVRQMGVVETQNGGQLVVTMAAQPAGGSLGSGTQMLDRLASWVTERAGDAPVEAPGC